MCRKVIEAIDSGNHGDQYLGRRPARRAASCIIDDCVIGIDQIMHCDELIATPINLGSSELISINDLVEHGRRYRGREAEALVRPGRSQRRGRPQQRQHYDPERAGLGAADSAAGRNGQNLRLDSNSSPIARPASAS